MHYKSLRSLAISATLHCLTGCAIGEVLGMVIGTALGLMEEATNSRVMIARDDYDARRWRDP